MTTQCHSLGRKERKTAFSPSWSNGLHTSSAADWCICCSQQQLVLILAEKQNSKSTGMQLYETGWACVTAYCCWGEHFCFLFNSFFICFSFSSAHSFPPRAPTLRHLCPLRYMFSSKWYLPGTVLWHWDQLARNSTLPIHHTRETSSAWWPHTSCLWGMVSGPGWFCSCS